MDKPEPRLQAVCLALGLQAKNLYNSIHFAVHNALSAYCRSEATGWVLRENLHPRSAQFKAEALGLVVVTPAFWQR